MSAELIEDIESPLRLNEEEGPVLSARQETIELIQLLKKIEADMRERREAFERELEEQPSD